MSLEFWPLKNIYKSIRECFLFVYKIAESNCCSQVFADFIQTQRYSTFLSKISILTICHIKPKLFFFLTFFFVLELFTIEKTYFINYKLQKTNKPSTTHFNCPSGYWKPSPFVYSPISVLPPLLRRYFLLYIVCFFHCLLKFFPLCL